VSTKIRPQQSEGPKGQVRARPRSVRIHAGNPPQADPHGKPEATRPHASTANPMS
jgi:hypothetical protein